ncbi:hypothetical protein C8J56DRAFT_1054279 [Mycena floridula]|nr:hypothetical protein C8J56DRAFT_1054279 [Mycena floridula]
MDRPRKYNTEDEWRQAGLQASHKFYQRNATQLRASRKKRYHTQQETDNQTEDFFVEACLMADTRQKLLHLRSLTAKLEAAFKHIDNGLVPAGDDPDAFLPKIVVVMLDDRINDMKVFLQEMLDLVQDVYSRIFDCSLEWYKLFGRCEEMERLESCSSRLIDYSRQIKDLQQYAKTPKTLWAAYES